jgi:hypothetical protein
MDEDIVIPIAGMLMIIVLSIGVPLVVGLTRRWQKESEHPRIKPDMSARLERIEQAVDAIAIEVERISEAQRFTTKLLTDRGAAAEPSGVSARHGQG